ncbi:MAG: response regulator transcription factor [Deltaproteobacteria bacterium]|nr:response regulator transcription factor [Deltaproteobacteria bacterium]MBI4795259.1 response regulator transcription factor [Deltaproteobacteria bacterium]
MPPKTPPYRIILADDHPMFREGIKRIIDDVPHLKAVGEVGDGAEVLNMLRESLPDMVILDLTMPGMHGTEVTKEIKNRYPQVKVLILTMHKSKEHLSRGIMAGADGYLLKENAFGDLISAIETIRQGGSYISSLLSAQMIDFFRQKARSEPEDVLSSREKEVLSLLVAGKSSKDIAKYLSLSAATVHAHLGKIKKKLDIKNNAELIKYGLQKGYSLED